jgi:hypothetical protein
MYKPYSLVQIIVLDFIYLENQLQTVIKNFGVAKRVKKTRVCMRILKTWP